MNDKQILFIEKRSRLHFTRREVEECVLEIVSQKTVQLPDAAFERNDYFSSSLSLAFCFIPF